MFVRILVALASVALLLQQDSGLRIRRKRSKRGSAQKNMAKSFANTSAMQAIADNMTLSAKAFGITYSVQADDDNATVSAQAFGNESIKHVGIQAKEEANADEPGTEAGLFDCCKVVAATIEKLTALNVQQLQETCENPQVMDRITTFMQAVSLSDRMFKFITDLPGNIQSAYPAETSSFNAARVAANFASQVFKGCFPSCGQASEVNQTTVNGTLSTMEWNPEDVLQSSDVLFPKRPCQDAREIAEKCDFVPKYAESYPRDSIAAQLRMKQATVAAMLRLFISEQTKSKSGGLLKKLNFGQRVDLFYNAYWELSGNGAGVYYPNEKGADKQPAALATHIWDITRRCTGPSCAYKIGIEYEKSRGVFRAWNALEASLLYSCFDWAAICPPWFTPVTAPLAGTLTDDTFSDADFWAINYAFAKQNFGEALWLPVAGQERTPIWCAADTQFSFSLQNVTGIHGQSY